MLNLIKEILRSMKRNVLAVVSLILLIFMAAFLFTNINDTTGNLNRSYTSLVNNGNLHDLTVDEMMPDGELDFSHYYSGASNNLNSTTKYISKSDSDYSFSIKQTAIASIKYTITDDGQDIMLSSKTPFIVQMEQKHGRHPIKTDVTIDFSNPTKNTQWIIDTLNSPANINVDGQYGLDMDMYLDQHNLPTTYDYSQISKWQDHINKDGTFTYNNLLTESLMYSSKSPQPANTTNDWLLVNDWTHIKTSGKYQSFYIENWNNGDYTKYFQNTLSSIPMGTFLSSETNAEDILNKIIVNNFDEMDSEMDKVVGKDNWRHYEALDMTTAKDHNLYKMIKTSNQDQVDKIDLYAGERLDNPKDLNLFSVTLQDIIDHPNNYTTKVNIKNIKNVMDTFEFFAKASNQTTKSKDYTNAFNELLSPTITPTQWKTDIKKISGSGSKGGAYIENKEYKLIVTYDSIDNIMASDYSSFSTILSPGFAKANNKVPLSPTVWNEHQSDTQDDFNNWITNLSKNNPENVVDVGGSKYIVLGIGLTPDFMYPIFNAQYLMPDTTTQALLYVNDNGFNNIHDAQRSASIEQYIVAKTKSGVSLQSTLDQINDWSAIHMNWPSNINAAHGAKDMTNKLNVSAGRVSFLGSLLGGINIVSTFLISFVIILSLIVGSIIIRKFITSNRISIAIMKANGYRSRDITKALMIIPVLITVLGGIPGYFLGNLAQTGTIMLFSDFWTVPTDVISFSWVAFLVVLIVPWIIFSLIILASTFYTLRGTISELMKEGSDVKPNILSNAAKKAVNKLGVMTKLRTSLAFHSTWKLTLLMVMSAAAISSITFSVSTQSQFSNSRDKSFEGKNYEFMMNLYSPTIEGGQYIGMPFEDFGKSIDGVPNTDKYVAKPPNVPWDQWKDKDQQWDYINTSVNGGFRKDPSFVTNYKPSTLGNYNSMSFPSMTDLPNMSSDPEMLKYKVQSKTAYDHKLGIGAKNSNAWQIAVAMMPDGQKQIAEQSFSDFMSYVYDNNLPLKKFIIKNGTEENPKWDFKEKDINNTLFLNEEFVGDVIKAYQDEGCNTTDFKLGYDIVPIESTDETYTYLQGSVDSINGKKNSKGSTITVNGIKTQDDKHQSRVKLYDTNNKYLNDELNQTLKNNVYPIIPNAFAAQNYNLHIGDKIIVNADNNAYRNQTNDAMKKDFDSHKKAVFKVIDITATYYDNEFYANQNDINKALGYDDPNFENRNALGVSATNAKGLSNSIGNIPFNGIITPENPKNSVPYTLYNGLSLYSPSGLYPATDKWDQTAAKKMFMSGNKTANNSSAVMDYISGATGIALKGKKMDEKAENLYKSIVKIYGSSPLVTTISNVNNKGITLNTFNQLTSTTEKISSIVIGIIIPISFLMVLLIASMLISDARKLVAMLKSLGFSDREAASIFLSIDLPVFVLGLLISLPFIYVISLIFSTVVFNFANILLSGTISWLGYGIAAASMIVIFYLTYLFSKLSIKNMNLVQELK